jgi:hypothetical protein
MVQIVKEATPPALALIGPGGGASGIYTGMPCILRGWSATSTGASKEAVGLTGTTPSVGTDWSYTTLSGLTLVNIMAVLATDATGTSRYPNFMIAPPTGPAVFQSGTSYAQAVSIVKRYQWGQGLTTANTTAGSDLYTAIPPLVVPAGTVISTVTANLDPADQWSSIVIVGVGGIANDDLATIYTGTDASGPPVAYINPADGDGTTTWLGDEGVYCPRGLYASIAGDFANVILYATPVQDVPVSQ